MVHIRVIRLEMAFDLISENKRGRTTNYKLVYEYDNIIEMDRCRDK